MTTVNDMTLCLPLHLLTTKSLSWNGLSILKQMERIFFHHIKQLEGGGVEGFSLKQYMK